MAGLFDKVSKFARSPQGKQAIAKVQRAANDPATRSKIQGGLDRAKSEVAKRRGGSGGAGPSGSGQVGR